MKKFFSIILTIAFGFLALGTADVSYFGETPGLSAFAASADDTSVTSNVSDPATPVNPVKPLSNEITAENVSLEYSSIPFNGGIRKPAVTVKLGETTLQEGVDFTAKYPENCTAVGEKTVVINGVGNFKGEARTSYEIVPLDCSNNPEVTVEVGACRYNGLPQYPDITVKIGDYVIPKTDYTVTLSDNVEVSTAEKKARCTLKFRGSCTGERTEEFSVLPKKGEDFQIDVAAKAGQSLSIDLTPMKPAGAIFGNPVFPSKDFSPSNQPKIAFNLLKFTLSATIDKSTMIAIPVTNIANCEDSWLEFYIEITEREIPGLVLKPLTKTYNGKPLRVSALNENGSYAHINGEAIEGEWSFVEPSVKTLTMPCGKTLISVKFTPDDPRYSHAYGLVSASILRKEAAEFAVRCNTKKLYLGQTLRITAKGVPDDFDGSVTVTAVGDGERDKFTILSEKETAEGKEFEIDFPANNAYHTLNVTLGGSAFYAPKTIEIKVKVGDPPDKPQDNVPTTEQQLMELIAKAEPDSTIKASLMTRVSAEALHAAAAKRLTVEVKANDVIAYVLEPAKMRSISALDLTTNAAVIPEVLFDRQGDKEIYSFTSFTSFAKGNGGVSIKALIVPKPDLSFICFYKYGASGELEHIASIPANRIARFGLPSSGKFAITASNASHIYGDLDNDCKVSYLDAIGALRLIVEIDTPSAEQLALLDFDGDNKLSYLDARTLLMYSVNLSM